MRIATYLSATCACLVLFSGISASAQEGDPRINELLTCSTGATRSELETAIKEVAASSGQSQDAIIDEQLKECRDEIAASREAIENIEKTTLTPRSSSRKENRDPVVGQARHAGDIWWAPATTAGVQHGHTGIYRTTTTTVEALGGGVTANIAARNRTARGTQKKYVLTSQKIRNAAGEWAYNKRRQKYRFLFVANKTSRAPYNCSQLVWAAYIESGGPDLDSDGGHTVMPMDIRNSPHTRWYQTIN